MARLSDAIIYRTIRLLYGLVTRLPYERAVAFGAAFGRTWARLGLLRTARARENLRRCFPEWTEAERERVRIQAFRWIGQGAVEAVMAPTLSREKLEELVPIEGLEHYEKARAASRTGGLIILTAHFGSWELGAASMGKRGFPLAIVHRKIKNEGIEKMVVELRRRSGMAPIVRGQAGLAVLRALRKGKAVVMPLDQNARHSQGVFVPFFGELAGTRDGPARLAMRTGTPVVPVFVLHHPDDPRRHIMRFLPPIELAEDEHDPQGAILTNVARMTALIEDAIREHPDHWIWIHRRWKTRPPEPSQSSKPLSEKAE